MLIWDIFWIEKSRFFDLDQLSKYENCQIIRSFFIFQNHFLRLISNLLKFRKKSENCSDRKNDSKKRWPKHFEILGNFTIFVQFLISIVIFSKIYEIICYIFERIELVCKG